MTDKPSPVRKVRYKILLITDSLAFPRLEPEAVMYEDTYIALLKSEFPQCDFIHHGRGGATIVDLFKHSTYYHQTLRPDLVFMQSGVVDCAPRALTVIEQQVISRLPLVSRPIASLVKRYSHMLRRARKMTYTPLETFVEYVSKFESIFQNVYWIDILPVFALYESKVEGMQRNTETYSAILRTHKYIGTAQFQVGDIMTDFHHLSCEGHRKMCALLSQVIRREFPPLISQGSSLGRLQCHMVAPEKAGSNTYFFDA